MPARAVADDRSAVSLIREICEFRRAARASEAAAAAAEAVVEEALAAAVDAVAPAASTATAFPPPELVEDHCDCGPRSGRYCTNPLAHTPYPRLAPEDIYLSPVVLTPTSISSATVIPTSRPEEMEFPVVSATLEYTLDARIKWRQRRRARAAGQPC